MADLDARLALACRGKSYSQGGFNVPDLVKILRQRKLVAVSLTRKHLLAAICAVPVEAAKAPAPAPAQREDRLDKACMGMTQSNGGLNLADLRDIASRRGLPHSKSMSRSALIRVLCGKGEARSDAVAISPSICAKEGSATLDLGRLSVYGHHLKYKVGGKTVVLKRHGEPIGSGTYGSVLLYRDSTKKYQVAVKVFSNHNAEYDLVKQLFTKGGADTCHIVNARAIKLPLHHHHDEMYEAIVMNLMDGSLDDLIEKMPADSMTVPVALDIMRVLAATAACLLSHGYIYTDYKPANLLYRCQQNLELVSIVYGDLGGLEQTDGNLRWLCYTYPPWEDKLLMGAIPNDKITVWGIALCFVNLFANVASDEVTDLEVPLRFDYIDKAHDTSEIKVRLHNFIRAIKLDRYKTKGGMSVARLVTSMLDEDPATRISLSELVKVLG